MSSTPPIQGGPPPWRISVLCAGGPGQPLHLRRLWFRFFTLVSTPLSLLLLASALGSSLPGLGRLVLGLCGAGLLWFSLAYLVNRSHLRVEGGTLRSRHGPVPFLARSWTLQTEAIKGFAVRSHEIELQHSGTQIHYLVARLKDGSEPHLLEGEDCAELSFLHRRLEQHFDSLSEPGA